MSAIAGSAKSPPGEVLWDVLLRVVPGAGTLGLPVLGKFVPWFGWLLFVGFVDGLHSSRVIGGLSNDQYQALATEGVRQSVLILLRNPLDLAFMFVLLLALAVHASYIPPNGETSGPPAVARKRWEQLNSYYHVAKAYYNRHYYLITAALFIVLFVLLMLPWASSLPVVILLVSTISIPLYAFRHGGELKAGQNRQAASYLVLVIILAMTVVAYPYSFGRVFYRPIFVLTIAQGRSEPSKLAMRLEPPGFDASIYCQGGSWVVKFATLHGLAPAREDPYASLGHLPWQCEGDRIVPAVQYGLPPSP